jgi:exodeoxyribonuclease VIII
MNTYAYLIKAKAKAADAKNLFCWFSAKSDSRADREILNILEDNGIETGRGADHQLPIRTNWFVVDDLPEEKELDDSWCDRYELAEDGLSWQKIVVAVSIDDTTVATGDISVTDLPANEDLHVDQHDDENTHYPVMTISFRKQLLVQLTGNELRHHITRGEYAEITDLEMDTDNSYVQNLLLVAENCTDLKKSDTAGLWRYSSAIKQVFPQDKRHELSLILQFTRIWLETDHINRGILTKEWAKGNRVTSVNRTDTNTNAGGGNATDRNPELAHNLDSLALEIALATLPMDFNIYDLPGSVYRRAKEIVSKKESPYKEWSAALRSTPGILDYSRAAIFALIRSAKSDLHHFPESLRTFISANLTESNHAQPSPETLAAARHTPAMDAAEEVERLNPDSEEVAQESEESLRVERFGNGMFSIDGLSDSQPKQPISVVDELRQRAAVEKLKPTPSVEATNNEQMEEAEHNETETGSEVHESEAATQPAESDASTTVTADPLNFDSGHHNKSDVAALYSHLMIDIESMGTHANAPIVSIGAVLFDPATGQQGAEFYKAISLKSAMAWGAEPEAETILWWLKQSAEARSAIAMDDTIPLDDALLQLTEFICENAANGPGNVEVWGNGATFDNVIVRNSYERTGLDCPWHYSKDRDVRTVVTMGKSVGCDPRYQIPFEGDVHNALADARHQARYVSAIWQKLTAN